MKDNLKFLFTTLLIEIVYIGLNMVIDSPIVTILALVVFIMMIVALVKLKDDNVYFKRSLKLLITAIILTIIGVVFVTSGTLNLNETSLLIGASLISLIPMLENGFIPFLYCKGIEEVTTNKFSTYGNIMLVFGMISSISILITIFTNSLSLAGTFAIIAIISTIVILITKVVLLIQLNKEVN